MVQEATPSQDTQLSFATTGLILQNEQFFSQVPQEPNLTFGTQLSIAATNSTLHSGSFFSQLLQDFDKNYGNGSSKGLRQELCPDEDLKSSSEKEKGTRSKSVKSMKLRKAKEANQDIGAVKTPYLTNQEKFINETGFPGFYTQQEHTANWFHTKTSNGLGDMLFTSQTIYTESELVLFKESNSLLKECETQTHVWKPEIIHYFKDHLESSYHALNLTG
ncbi:hypothetical protein DY000_02053441 [Brassica cretica]|uniref:Protein FAR1-RELATED SEQUENCE n=1 Tax=Brassica cretica TaxID=69181 RepID=A0ABQ7A771_BRACR|nr:hypothetical protein DY000_02053441 [Brassica cretica]